jgi:hypothetical protein
MNKVGTVRRGKSQKLIDAVKKIQIIQVEISNNKKRIWESFNEYLSDTIDY